MAQNKKQIIATIVAMSLAMQAFVTTNAVCPSSLNACVNLPLLSSQYSTECCPLIRGIIDAEVKLCLCDVLKFQSLGQTLAGVLGLPIINSLPIVGGLLGTVLPGITSDVLDLEIVALVNACGLDKTKYHCDAY